MWWLAWKAQQLSDWVTYWTVCRWKGHVWGFAISGRTAGCGRCGRPLSPEEYEAALRREAV